MKSRILVVTLAFLALTTPKSSDATNIGTLPSQMVTEQINECNGIAQELRAAAVVLLVFDQLFEGCRRYEPCSQELDEKGHGILILNFEYALSELGIGYSSVESALNDFRTSVDAENLSEVHNAFRTSRFPWANDYTLTLENVLNEGTVAREFIRALSVLDQVKSLHDAKVQEYDSKCGDVLVPTRQALLSDVRRFAPRLNTLSLNEGGIITNPASLDYTCCNGKEWWKRGRCRKNARADWLDGWGNVCHSDDEGLPWCDVFNLEDVRNLAGLEFSFAAGASVQIGRTSGNEDSELDVEPPLGFLFRSTALSMAFTVSPAFQENANQIEFGDDPAEARRTFSNAIRYPQNSSWVMNLNAAYFPWRTHWRLDGIFGRTTFRRLDFAEVGEDGASLEDGVSFGGWGYSLTAGYSMVTTALRDKSSGPVTFAIQVGPSFRWFRNKSSEESDELVLRVALNENDFSVDRATLAGGGEVSLIFQWSGLSPFVRFGCLAGSDRTPRELKGCSVQFGIDLFATMPFTK